MKTEKSRRLQAVVLLIFTAILWSTGGVLIKSIRLSPMAIAGLRSLIALPLIWLVLPGRKLEFSRDRLLGAFFYAATVILFVAANKLTTAANAILLQFTAPLYVAIFGYLLLHEKPLRRDWLVIAISFSGLGLFFFDRLKPGHALGNLLAILSGIFFGLLIVYLRKHKESPLGIIFTGNLMTAVVMSPFFLPSLHGSVGDWLLLVLLGLFQLGLSYILFSFAIRHVRALEAALIPIIEPVLNPFWVFLIIGEIPGTWAIAGGCIILLAVSFYSISSIRRGSV